MVSKQTKVIKDNSKTPQVNFLDMIKKFEDEVRVILWQFYGGQYAATKNKPARATIALPEDICGTDLRDLEKWHFFILAIPNEIYKKMVELTKEIEKYGKDAPHPGMLK